MSKRSKENITLGSGKLYYQEFTDTVPDVETLCVPGNLMGHIKGGASIEYTAEKTEEKDDLGLVSKIITTSEEALLKCGLLTWNGETLTKLTDRGTTSESGGRRITKIGGAGNSNSKNYVWCFFHEDKKDGNLWVLVVGQNQAGFTITFAADAGSIVEPEIKAIPHDDAGTLIELIEELDSAG